MRVDRKWLEQNGKKPSINAVPLAGSGYDRKKMLMRLYNALNTVAYNIGKAQADGFSKDSVIIFVRKAQELISDIIEERPIEEADCRETMLTSLLLYGRKD